MYKKKKKIKLSENEIKLLICTLEASLDSARIGYFSVSEAEKMNALETQRKKAQLIQKLKQFFNM